MVDIASVAIKRRRRSGAMKANQKKSIGKGLSLYQLFKAALDFLGVFL